MTQAYGVDPTNNTLVDGWTVQSIEDDEPISVLTRYADQKIGYTKDLGSRLNLAINGYGTGLGFWAYRTQEAFAIPESETISYTLVNPKNRTLLSAGED